MTVVVERLVNELQGINSIKWEAVPPPRKNICTSRSFGSLVTGIKDLQQAVAAHASACARKLRQEQSCAKQVHVFIETNPFRRQDRQYFTGVTIPLTVASNSTTEIIKFTMRALAMIFQPGYNYQKAGVMVLDLVSQDTIQLSLFDQRDRSRERKLMTAIDKTNNTFGKDIVRYGTHDYGKKWHLRRLHLSNCYTTRLDQVMKVKAK